MRSLDKFAFPDDEQNDCHVVALRGYDFTVFYDTTDDFAGIFLEF